MEASPAYDAFISYRRSDGGRAARWLRRELQHFRAPKRLARLRGRRLKIYLDTAYERGTTDFYVGTIRPALMASRHLIVVATPEAVQRPAGQDDWIVREIEDFTAGPFGENVLVVRAAGGFDDRLPGDLNERFPHIEIVDLSKVGRFWFLHPTRATRISAEKLKLVAPLLDVAPDEMPVLRQEEERAQQIRLGAAAGTTLATLVAVTGLSVYALESRWRAEQALDSSLFAVGRMLESVTNGLERTAGDDLRGNLVNQACDLIDQLAAEATGTPNPENLVTCMIERGLAFEAQGQHGDADAQIQAGIDLIDTAIAAKLTHQRTRAAIGIRQAAIDLARMRKDGAAERAALAALGDTIGPLARKLKAVDLIGPAADADVTLAGQLQSDGDTEAALGRAETALAYLADGDSWRLPGDAGYREERARILAAIGYVNLDAGSRDRALDAFRQSATLSREVGDKISASGLIRRAEVLVAMVDAGALAADDAALAADIATIAAKTADLGADEANRFATLKQRLAAATVAKSVAGATAPQ